MHMQNRTAMPMDYGADPYVVNLESATKQNSFYRRTLWTGYHLQVTLMSIPPQGEIGLEVHENDDQFLRIEEGCGIARMGSCRDNLSLQRTVSSGDAVLVPAGTWHNVVNTGKVPLKIYSIYAPPHHPKGTVHRTKEESDARGD